ncbi:CLIP-associating protein isoform X3 [Atheta coriaria]|uniref:CLIP-associating protein isoform X3 n=1 Tax=Dalotia coriaria TaxID=877792 RepID=UPI0031F4528E
MAYTCPRDLDGFMPHLPKNDTKFRQQLGADLLAYLAEPSNPMYCQDIGQLVDGLIPWMQSSNYKVSSNGIEIMTYLADRLGQDFRPYLQTVLPCVIDRLGDAKDTVREKAQLLILKLLEREVLSPQSLLEKLTPGFTHKNAKIREEVLRCLVNTLNEHGAASVTLSKFIPHIVKLLADPASSVRDTAFATLVDLYKHVGEKLRVDLQKRNLVPAQKLATLLTRFDEVRDAGELLRTATTSLDYCTDEVDRMSMPKPNIPVKKAGLGSAIKKTPSVMRTGSSAYTSAAGAGAVDEEVFLKQFEDVATIQLFTPRELNDHMKSVQEIISDSSKDWNKRVDALKKIRSLIIAGATAFDDFHVNLRNLERPLVETIKDLRSQVVREGCITIAFLAQSLGSKFDHAAEILIVPLINLIQNSAKIMATSGHTCVRFIIQYTQSPRLIPIITSNLQNSKSKDIRRSCCEFLEVILSYWPAYPLEKHIALLQEAVKRGIGDADSEARVISRKAFRGFRDHFPEQAEALLQSLDPSHRKALQSDLCLSSSSSSGSLAQQGSMSCRPVRKMAPPLSTDANGRKGFRSNSAIDLQAAQRAKARNQYSAMARQKIASGTASLPRPKKTDVTPPMTQSPERSGRSRSRNSGVSHSQPTSRSGSPSSRLSYHYNRIGHALDSDSPRPRRLSSGIPRSITGSRDTSRETSPTRGGSLSRFRRNSDRPPMSPASRPPVMAQKILQQSREAETALADALNYDPIETDSHRLNSPRRMRSIENHSDDSETSSVCSERSFDSYRRPSDSYSWSGSQNRLSSRDYWEPCHDIHEIIHLCASTVWQERKDGLVSLSIYLKDDHMLTSHELKDITEICTRMFVDSHTKGLSVFLDTLNELINKHSVDLQEWLYILMHRIFFKLGTDLLMSAQTKLQATLENVKVHFPIEQQLIVIYKILGDSFQTPNTKVKLAVLSYLTSIYRLTGPGQLLRQPPASQALQKIISYVKDSKSSEIRNAARTCIIAMWNCNVADVTMMLGELPKEMQDIASDVVRNQMRSISNNGSPKPTSPHTPTHNHDLNSEEIYKSLKRTTAEIQNYSYETGSKLDRERDTTSHDSGISQMSIGNNDIKNDIVAIEERFENLHVRSTYATHSMNGLTETDSNGYDKEVNEEQVVLAVLEYCLVDNPLSTEQKCALLEKLVTVINQGRVEPVIQNFKKLLKIFLETLNQAEVKSVVVVLRILAEILKKPEMEQCWSNFIELLTLRVLDAVSSENREVRIAAELTTTAMSVFPFHTVVNTLSPLVQTSSYPRIDGAMKMITRLIDQHPNELTDDHLTSLMPGLIKANDHEQSSARKSAVFCMVAIHKAVGEERMSPHLRALPGSKMKLFRIYIDKENDAAAKSARHKSS